ncbi:MAG: carbohydrate ABC transporter permease [Lachnospiraceae bacterium]|nr:carbohydrate ABC transporter permease [Lachnospiraceae bacterium]
MRKKKKFPLGQAALHVLFLIMTITYIVPFLMVISVSFTDEKALVREGYHLIPSEFSTAAYRMVFSDPTQLLNSYGTTIIFTAIATFLAVLIMGIMAYPLSRPHYRFKGPVTFLVFFTMLFSGGMVPSYLLIVKYLHLNNTIWVYILPGLVSAYNLIVIRTNYKSLPGELIEAAKIDGASELYICFKIVMPLCKPVLASIGFLFLVNKWNDWNTSLLYITDPKLYSLQYLLQKILKESEFLMQLAETGQLMGGEVFPTESFRYAMAMVAAGPVLVVFPFFQKYFAKGMTLGSVKG